MADIGGSLPDLCSLVAVADRALHPWVRQHVPPQRRRAALSTELDFALNTAARDPDYAAQYASVAPQIGAPVEAYADRWLPLASGGHVLAGPRYLGRDPDLPFVDIAGSDRELGPDDRDALVDLARTEFAVFRPGFVLLQSARPVDEWPGCATERRTVAGVLGELRSGPVSPGVVAAARTDLDSYDAYRAIYDSDLAADSARARMAGPENREDFAEYAANGLLFDVLVDGEWAGVIAAEIGSRRGLPGAVVAELVLAQPFRGRGLGSQLSTLLARSVPLDDTSCWSAPSTSTTTAPTGRRCGPAGWTSAARSSCRSAGEGSADDRMRSAVSTRPKLIH